MECSIYQSAGRDLIDLGDHVIVGNLPVIYPANHIAKVRHRYSAQDALRYATIRQAARSALAAVALDYSTSRFNGMRATNRYRNEYKTASDRTEQQQIAMREFLGKLVKTQHKRPIPTLTSNSKPFMR